MQSSHLPNFERTTYFHGIHLSLNQTSKVSASSTKRTSEDRIAAKQEHSRKRLVSGVAIISRFSLVSASDRLWKARVRKTEEPLTKGKNYKNERSEVSPRVLSSFTKNVRDVRRPAMWRLFFLNYQPVFDHCSTPICSFVPRWSRDLSYVLLCCDWSSFSNLGTFPTRAHVKRIFSKQIRPFWLDNFIRWRMRVFDAC